MAFYKHHGVCSHILILFPSSQHSLVVFCVLHLCYRDCVRPLALRSSFFSVWNSGIILARSSSWSAPWLSGSLSVLYLRPPSQRWRVLEPALIELSKTPRAMYRHTPRIVLRMEMAVTMSSFSLWLTNSLRLRLLSIQHLLPMVRTVKLWQRDCGPKS